ncbi:MAG: ABC transporter permease [Flavobacteriales bacterium]|nr:ABC transporter permease [Flavobacteriales bacterium]
MWRNYFKTTVRSLTRNRIYAGVSILGLGLGISCAVLIALYITDELSYEDMHVKKERIYRGYIDLEMTEVLHAGVSPMALGPTLVSDYPEFETFSRIVSAGNEVTVRVEDRIYTEEHIWFADSSFFDIFSFDFILGDPASALIEPNSVVLSRTMAEKVFGTYEVLDTTVRLNNSVYTVTGVTEDPPLQTEMYYHALVSLNTWPQQSIQQASGDWYWLISYTYLLTHQPIEQHEIDRIMADFKERYIVPFQESNGLEQDAFYDLKPLEGLHFYTAAEYDHPKGNLSYLYIFGVVGLFIVIIASINFVNLSLAQSGKRAKEVGIRKTLGGDKKEIRRQFLGESMLVAFLASLVGLALVEVMIPTFNSLSGKDFSFSSLFRGELLLSILLLWLTVGLLSGSYPAFVLSRFDPVRVLKGHLPSFGRIGALRKTLVVVQFVFSLLMIVVFQQMDYMRNRNLGFEGDQVLVLEMPGDTAVRNRGASLRTELEQLPQVEYATLSTNFPGRTVGELLFRIEQDGALKERGIKFMTIDEHFLETYRIDLLSGRNFRRDGGTDANQAFIINETAAERFGWHDEALGKRMQWGLLANDSAAYDGRVVGVVEDFHFQSLHNPIEPMVFRFNPGNSNLLAVKLNGDDLPAAMAAVERTWDGMSGGYPFDYQFVDDEFDALYRSEERMLTVFGYFSFISIFIAALGLFALSSFTIEQRIKEIGIRKILGASVTQIIRLISRDFMLLVGIAVIISLPVAYVALQHWLQDFAYRIELSIFILLISAGFAFALAFATVGYHSLRAARANPVNALRYE